LEELITQLATRILKFNKQKDAGVKRISRLTSTMDIKRVRRSGKSYAHPLMVLIIKPSELGRSRFAVSAGRSVGKAVQRNRAKRMLREAIRPLIVSITTGWDIVLIARQPQSSASFQDTQMALIELLQRAQLLYANNN